MKINSILTKSVAAVSLSVAGIATVNTMNNNDAQAAVVKNDAAVYTVHQSTTVYNDYENGQATGQVLAANTSWKVIKTAYDAQGNKWYDLGKNQWVKVETEVRTNNTQSTNTYNYNNQNGYSQTTSNNTVSSYSANNSYSSNATGSEASAKAWIAGRESGGSYSARNGQYIGKYQLSASYLHGDYSAANQERVANNYVKGRYGSWAAAKSFWQANGWY